MSQASKSLHISKTLTSVELIGGRECNPEYPLRPPDLLVYGGARIMKNSCFVGDINIGGDINVEGNLSVLGNTNLNDVFADNVYADVVQARELVGNISCDCTITANVIQVNGDLEIDGNLVFNGDLCTTGNINIAGGEVVTGDLIILGNLTGNLTLSPNTTIGLNPTLLDAFGGQRVTNPYSLFDTKFLTSKKEEFWDEIIQAGATSTFFPSYVTLQVTTNGDRVIRQSRPYLPYQPGKGIRIMCTGTLINALTPDTISRIGFFDDTADKNPMLDTEMSGNGYFFEWDGTTMNVVERSYITGAQVDNKIPQSMWNVDRFDGTGPSGIFLDITKRQIFMFELEWLGVGTVVSAIIINRTIYWAHLFHHANLLTQLPYISRPTLPVRYEISSQGGAAHLQQVCCTVISDGGYSPRGSVFSRSMGGSSDVSIGGGHQALIALRLKATNKRATLNLLKTTVLATSGNDFYVAVYRFVGPAVDPFSGTASWISAGSYSAAEYAIQNTMLTMTFNATGGILLDETYVSNRADIGGSDLADRFGAIVTASITGISDIIVIAGGPDAGTKAAAALQWQELD